MAKKKTAKKRATKSSGSSRNAKNKAKASTERTAPKRKNATRKKAVKKTDSKGRAQPTRRTVVLAAATSNVRSKAPRIENSWQALCQKAKAVLERHRRELADPKKYSDIVGFDVGPKIRNGCNLMTPAIRLYVRKKNHNRDSIAKTKLLPSWIEDVPVDVHESNFKPAILEGGDIIGPFGGPPGSLGVLVKDDRDFRFLLTCAHVLEANGDIDGQHPISMQDDAGTNVGTSIPNPTIPGSFLNWRKDAELDAALVNPRTGLQVETSVDPPEGHSLPVRFGIAIEQDETPPATVWKRGMHGVGIGQIVNVSSNQTLTDGTQVTNHILVQATSGTFDLGDSGSCLVRGNEIIGIVRAIDTTSEGATRILASRVEFVMSEFGVVMEF